MLASKTTTAGLRTKNQSYLSKVIYSRKIVFASLASCLRKDENSFPQNFFPFKYYYTGERDYTRQVKEIPQGSTFLIIL